MAEDVKHDYHLVNPSPWPLIGSIAVLALAIGGADLVDDDVRKRHGRGNH